jgi:hypothetical protein
MTLGHNFMSEDCKQPNRFRHVREMSKPTQADSDEKANDQDYSDIN